MPHRFSRTELLLGAEALERLAGCHVALFGVGGVGGHVAEALGRGGVGKITLVDNDIVSLTNCNRQLVATQGTLGRLKVEVMRERLLDINPNIEVEARACFYLPQSAASFDFASYDYVVDAVDTVTAKLDIVTRAQEAGVPVISAMGAGNKLDPTSFGACDISQTSVCPLAKVMRRELRKRGIDSLKVVYSREEALTPLPAEDASEGAGARRSTPGSVSFVPGVCGLIVAGEVIKDLVRGISPNVPC